MNCPYPKKVEVSFELNSAWSAASCAFNKCAIEPGHNQWTLGSCFKQLHQLKVIWLVSFDAVMILFPLYIEAFELLRLQTPYIKYAAASVYPLLRISGTGKPARILALFGLGTRHSTLLVAPTQTVNPISIRPGPGVLLWSAHVAGIVFLTTWE